MTDLNTFPVVLRQAKGAGGLLLVAGALSLLMAALVLVLAPTLGVVAGMSAFTGLLVLALGVAMRMRPARLTLTAEGLTLDALLTHRTWRWQQVSAFTSAWMRTGRVRSKEIVFTSPQAERLSGNWEMPLDEVIELLNHARTRWGG